MSNTFGPKATPKNKMEKKGDKTKPNHTIGKKTRKKKYGDNKYNRSFLSILDPTMNLPHISPREGLNTQF